MAIFNINPKQATMSKHFQTVVLITSALYTVLFFLPYTWQYIYTADIVYVLSSNGVGGEIAPNSPFYFIYSMLFVLSLMGLYSYKKAAKWLYCLLIAFNLLISPFIMGFSTSIYLDLSIGYLLTLFEGALLLLLFSDEVSSKLK